MEKLAKNNATDSSVLKGDFVLLNKNLADKNLTNKNLAENPTKTPLNKHEQWFERNEKASMFWLNITIFLVRYLPRFALNIAVIFVTFIYFIFSKKEQKNLKNFYALAKQYYPPTKPLPKLLKKPRIYLNFYYFGWAICDKVAAWIGKIRYENLAIKDVDFLVKELCSGGKGQILVMSHFGNVDVANAISSRFDNLHITAFVYQKNTQDFLKMIDKVSAKKLPRIFVSDIDIAKLLELKAILDKGGHIAIMGDRVAINSKRNMTMKFFGKDCIFPYGAFIIAYLLRAKISSLWCEKTNGKYHIELENLCENHYWEIPFKSRELAIKPILAKYIASLENHAINNPTQWFSFYDFWGGDFNDDFCKDSSNDFRGDFNKDSSGDSHISNDFSDDSSGIFRKDSNNKGK